MRRGYQDGFSTRSGNNGKNRHVPDNRDTRPADLVGSRPALMPGTRQVSQVRLANIQPGDGPSDEHALDLRGALEDGEVVGPGCL